MLWFSLVFSNLPCVLSFLIVLYSVLCLYEVVIVCYVAVLAFGWCARPLAGVFVLFNLCCFLEGEERVIFECVSL